MFVNALKERGYGCYNLRLKVQPSSLDFKTKARASTNCSEYKISSSTRVVDRLFSQAKDIGMQVVSHPFHVEMVEGTLCRKRFEQFIVQDILYLEGCIKAFELAQVRFPERCDLFELLILDTRVELDKHKEFRACFGIDQNFEQMNNACENYVEFLIEVAEKGELAEVIGALWPCYSVFLEMYHAYTKEMKLLTCEHPYYEHVKYYKELLALPSVEAMKSSMDDILMEAKDRDKDRLKKVFFKFFYISLEHERRFFDALYEASKQVSHVPRIINSIISIKERLLAMPRGSWVFWDLDDTLWIAALPLLRVINNALLERYIVKLELEYPNIRALIWELYYYCDYRLVEEEIVGLFADLKEKEIHVLGLTKRETGYSTISELKVGLSRQDLTLSQLNKLGVLFSSIFPEDEIMFKQKVGINPSMIKKGVAFTVGLDKGLIILEILDKARELRVSLPPQIGFLDDLHENILSVEERLKGNSEYDIPIFAVHYRGAENLFDDDQIDYEALTDQIRSLNEWNMRQIF